MPKTNTSTHIDAKYVAGNIQPENCSLNMIVSSQLDNATLQSTTHYAKSLDEMNAWFSTFEQYCLKAEGKQQKPLYKGLCVCIKILIDLQTTVFSREFKGLSRDDLNLWYDFFAEFAPYADERRL